MLVRVGLGLGLGLGLYFKKYAGYRNNFFVINKICLEVGHDGLEGEASGGRTGRGVVLIPMVVLIARSQEELRGTCPAVNSNLRKNGYRRTFAVSDGKK